MRNHWGQFLSDGSHGNESHDAMNSWRRERRSRREDLLRSRVAICRRNKITWQDSVTWLVHVCIYSSSLFLPSHSRTGGSGYSVIAHFLISFFCLLCCLHILKPLTLNQFLKMGETNHNHNPNPTLILTQNWIHFISDMSKWWRSGAELINLTLHHLNVECLTWLVWRLILGLITA